MILHNSNNERIKRQYFTYLKEAKRHDDTTVDAVAKALSRFEKYSNYRDFKKFHTSLAVGFKKSFAEQNNQITGEKLSKSTLHATLTHLKKFFQWLSGQPSYKTALIFSECEYFNLSEKETRIATTRREKRIPTIAQIKEVIQKMPCKTEIELRNRALIAFILLSGARDSAVASFKLKHVNLDSGSINQDAREVKTKFSKTFTTYFFPVGDEIRKIFDEWVVYLRAEKNWGDNDPLFPNTNIINGTNFQFAVNGLKKEHWSNAGPIRSIFKESFIAAGLPYFNPHCVRNTLVNLGQKMCNGPEEFKAWSQNLGHEKVLTTFYSYGEVEVKRQGDIIKDLGKPKIDDHLGLIKFFKTAMREFNESHKQNI